MKAQSSRGAFRRVAEGDSSAQSRTGVHTWQEQRGPGNRTDRSSDLSSVATTTAMLTNDVADPPQRLPLSTSWRGGRGVRCSDSDVRHPQRLTPNA